MTKADQVRDLVQAAIRGGMAVGRVIVRPKEIVIETLGESAEPADAAERWLREQGDARKAARRA